MTRDVMGEDALHAALYWRARAKAAEGELVAAESQVDTAELRCMAAEAEVARLREALTKHGKHAPLHPFHPEDGCAPSCPVCAALGEEA